MSKKKKGLQTVLWIAIITVALVDALAETLSNLFPVIGQILSTIGNWIFETLELGLIYGLWSTRKK